MVTWIIGHWASCNMGDRYQPYVVADVLLNAQWNWEGTHRDIRFVNFSDSDIGENMTFNVGNRLFDISGPSDIALPPARLAILVTGSMHYTSPYVQWIVNAVNNQRIEELVIWGGFSRGDEDFGSYKEKFAFLLNPKIAYYARSWRDQDLYEKLTSRPCRLAGDPMCYWVTDAGKEFGEKIEADASILPDDPNLELNFDLQGTIAIPSYYAFRYDRDFWMDVCQRCDWIVCIDTFEDMYLKSRYQKKCFIVNKPWIFLRAIRHCDKTVNGRLHSAVISACANLATTVVVTDNSDPGIGSFKFEAVGATGPGLGRPIARVTNTLDHRVLEISPDVYNVNSRKYVDLTLQTLNILRSCYVELISGKHA
jgi:hypothetical protein